MNRNQITNTVLVVFGFLMLVGGLELYQLRSHQGELVEGVNTIAQAVEPLIELEGTGTLGERVINLPDDAQQWYTVFLFRGSDPQQDPGNRHLQAIWAADPRLRSLEAQTKLFTYQQTDPLYRTRYAKHFGTDLPAIMLLRHDGKTIYKASGQNLPESGAGLAEEIRQAIADYQLEQCGPGGCPRPTPPAPMPGPEVVTGAPVLPDLRPPTVASDRYILIALICAAAIGAVFFLDRSGAPE